MVKYYFEESTFVIEDYQHAKRFCSFFPAIAGVDGKPLWAFYANIGQCMGGFGVSNKDTPITPFDSATLAYQNIPLKSFRTFLRIDGKEYLPFFDNSTNKRTLKINKTNFSISEETSLYRLTITYTSVSRRNYPALLRMVRIDNLDKQSHKYELCDGLPILFPLGLSNICYKELVSLMGAYCQVDLNNKAPFVKFKTSTGDNSVVSLAEEGNGFVSIDQNGRRLDNIVELNQIYGGDPALMEARGWNDVSFDELVKAEQQTENQLPSAFSLARFALKEKESYSFVTLYGSFHNIKHFNDAISELSLDKAFEMLKETEDLLDSYLPKNIKTNYPIFDKYIEQSVLDNNLRGGFPMMIGDKPYYVYSRKHGDMERDYNNFDIPSTYYSSGPGNFRDVNQNRRSDLYFVKDIKDFNIHLFFSLMQVDGQNPLTVKPTTFELKNKDVLKGLDKELSESINRIADSFSPAQLYTILVEKLSKKEAEELFVKIINQSSSKIQACFGEGYWIDHWTYNVDLLENYRSVYPDQMEALLFNETYPYFYSKVYVEPRDEKYCLLPNGKVRQYGAVDLAKFKKENEKNHLKGNETLWLKDENGKEIHTSLASKMTNLILVKFSTLDAYQMGIEMECEKPGWNDAMNGLPGIFASAMSESIELLRLVKYARESMKDFPDRKVEMLDDQYNLFNVIKSSLGEFLASKIDSFTYWDKVTSGREALRKNTHEFAKNSGKTLQISDILPLFDEIIDVLTKGIKEAKKLGNGIIPSYIVHEVDKYEKLNKKNHLGYEVVKPLHFKIVTIPPFLEASARMAKLGSEFFGEKEYELIKESDLRDQKLGLYKTCADIEDAPFEIGRVHAFTKGWLERECNFLHMTYKYLLGLLKAGLYERFYEEMKVNFVCFMDPSVYGRSPLENSSFIVPTCNPNKAMHGQGQFARLTGANAEVIDMFYLMFLGEHAFTYENGELVFAPSPKLSKDFFDDKDEVSFPLFTNSKVTYHNPNHLDCFKGVKLSYKINGQVYDEVKSSLAESIRNGEIKEVYIEVR